MASRKEEKDRLRRERIAELAKRSQSDTRRQRLAFAGAGAILLAVIVGLVLVIAKSGDEKKDPSGTRTGEICEQAHIQTLAGSVNKYKPDCREGTKPAALKQGDLKKAAAAANCDLRLNLPDEGNTHIKPTDPEPKYKTNPPTSGNHIVPPLQQADGAYAEHPDPKYTTHSIEHGRVDVQYSPELPGADQLLLKGIFDEDPAGMLLFPNPDMPYAVAATAWTQLVGCKEYSPGALDVIRDFRDVYRGQGPEPVPIVLAG